MTTPNNDSGSGAAATAGSELDPLFDGKHVTGSMSHDFDSDEPALPAAASQDGGSEQPAPPASGDSKGSSEESPLTFDFDSAKP